MRKRLGLRQTAGLTILVVAVAAVALAISGSAVASTSLHVSQIGADSTTYNHEGDCSNLPAGSVDWHFVLVQTTAVNSGDLTATFQNAGVIGPIHFDKQSGGVLHWDVITPSDDILLAASTTADGAILNLSHVCGGGGGSGGETSSLTTTVHLGATDSATPVPVDDTTGAALGSTVHDSADLQFSGGGTLPTGSTVFFSFFHNNTCDGTASDTTSVDVSGKSSPATGLDPVLPEGPLGAGEYSYIAVFVSGDSSKVTDALGDCEPFKINQGSTSTSTTIHLSPSGAVVSGPIASGDSVYDSATVTGTPPAFAPTGYVDFTFYRGGDCTTGVPEAAGHVALSGGVASPSTIEGPLTAGSYAFKAHYLGDTNYAGSYSDCEPFTVFQAGKTMGFWGNQNGIAKIIAGGGYTANAVNIGRGANIDTQAESLKVLPNQLNACGKGSVIIFSDQTTTKDCSVATGVNKASLNTLAAQTLALGYNIKLVSGYSGQTIGALGCTPVGSLTTSSTVNAAFTAAVALINGSASGGTTTQTQIGDMNTLLGCLNREV